MTIFVIPTLNNHRGEWRLSINWGFLKRVDPQVTVAISTRSWSSDLDDFGGSPHFRKPPNGEHPNLVVSIGW